MHVGPRASLEIPPTCIAGDTRDFGEDGIGRKTRAGMLGGMLGVVHGTKLLGIWSNPPQMQRLGNTERSAAGITTNRRRSRREPIKRLAFLSNVAPHEVSGFDLSSW